MAGKTKNTSKEQKVDFKIPNQTMIADIIEQYESVETINELIDTILKSDYFSTIKNVNTKDVMAYRENVNNILNTFSNMYNIISKMSFENVDFDQIKYYFNSFREINQIVNRIVTSDLFSNLNKINIFDVIEYADIVREFLEVFDFVARTLYSKKSTLRSSDVEKTTEQLFICITSIDPLVDYIIKSRKKINNATKRVRQVYSLINEIIEQTIKFSESVEKLNSFQDSFKILERFMAFINNTINNTTDAFTNIFKSMIKIFVYAIIAAQFSKKANQLRVWDSIAAGIRGTNKVLQEITSATDIDRLKTIGYSLISVAGENITGSKIGTGSKGDRVNFICNVFDAYKVIFMHAIIAGKEAKFANNQRIWTSISTAVNHINEIMSIISGSSDKDRIKTIGYNIVSAVASNATGKNIGTGSKGDKINFMLQAFETFKYIFFQAILAGMIAKKANNSKVWSSIKEAIINVNEIGELAGEESIESVLLDKYLGINEIALAEFNRDLMIALRQLFKEAIITGIIASLAVDLKSFEQIKESVKYARKVYEYLLPLIFFLEVTKAIDIIGHIERLTEVFSLLADVFDELDYASLFAIPLVKANLGKTLIKGMWYVLAVAAELILLATVTQVLENLTNGNVKERFKELTVAISLLPHIFLMLDLAALAAIPLKFLWKSLFIGIGVLSGVTLVITGLIFAISVLEEISGGDIVRKFAKLTLAIALLTPIFLLMEVAGIVAFPLQLLWKPLFIGIGVLAAVALGIGLISIIVDKSSILTNMIKLTISLMLLGVAFVELVSLGLLAIVAAVSLPFVLLGILVLGLISLALLLIIVPKSTLNTLLRLNLALLELIVAMGLILVMDYVLSLISFKRLFVNLFCIIGLFGLISLLFIGSLILIPILMIASITIVSILAIVTMLLIIAGALKLLEFIKLDKDKIYANVEVIIGVIKKIIYLFNAEKENADDIPEIDEDVWKVDKLLAVMMAVPLLATSFIVISFMLLIALELIILQHIKLDYDKIINNVDAILGAINRILEKLFDKPKKLEQKEGDSIWKKMGKSLFNFGNETLHKLIAVGDILLAIPMMLAAVIVVGLIYLTARMLKSISEIDFSDAVITKIHENIEKILECIRYLNTAIKKPFKKYEKLEKKKDDNWFVKGLKSVGNKLFSGVARAKDLIEAIINTGTLAIAFLNVGMVKLIAENLKTIQDIELNQSLIETRVDDIIKICNTINQKLNTAEFDSIDEDDVELFGDYVENIGDFIKNINKVNETKTEAFVKVIDKANTIDVDKIKTVRDMFEQMSRFSESVNGNFEKLADVLSEKLVDILEKLHITLQDLKDTTNGVQTNNIVVPAKPDYSESIVPAQNSAKNNINEQTKKNNEQERMIAQNQQLSQSINNSLSAIQSLLEEFDRRGILLRS